MLYASNKVSRVQNVIAQPIQSVSARYRYRRKTNEYNQITTTSRSNHITSRPRLLSSFIGYFPSESGPQSPDQTSRSPFPLMTRLIQLIRLNLSLIQQFR